MVGRIYISGIGLIAAVTAWMYVFAFTGSAASPGKDNPYAVIAERNAFELRPPPEPKPEPPPPKPKLDIKFTGISTMSGEIKAYFMAAGKGKEKPKYYCLGQGERQDQLEVIQIDKELGKVKVKNAGLEGLLTLAEDGVKKPPAPANPPPQPASAVAGSGGANQRNVSNKTTARNAQAQAGVPPPPTVAQRNQGNASSRTGRSGNASVSSNSRNSANVPARAIRTREENTSTVTKEQSEVLMEVMREMHQEDIATGQFPPLPPTSITPPSPGNQQQQQAPSAPGIPMPTQ